MFKELRSISILASYMGMILNIETATTNCSVSVAENGKLLAIKENNTPHYSHAEQLHVFIADVVRESNIPMTAIDAVAVSKGPGSYTGLRIGVSAAKGLCFALDVPLIAIPTLESMAYRSKKEDYDFIIPLLDARRMEVYSKVFNTNMESIRETKAEIIDASSFSGYLQKGKTLLLGSGAQKCKGAIDHPNAHFDSGVVPSSKEMAGLSYKKLKANDFENLAYFEPFYLKDFILMTKKA